MLITRAPRPPLPVLLICAPDDSAAAHALARRLRAEGAAATLAAELSPGPRPLREALAAAEAVVWCLSRRSWAGTELVPAIAVPLELLALTPAPRRLLITLRLTSCELPPALQRSTTLDLFSARGYEQLRAVLRDHAQAVAPPPPPPAPVVPPAPAIPALRLQGGFELPALARQGLLRRLGRGVARAIFLPASDHALVVSGGGPSLVRLAGGPPRWAIDCPTRYAALSPSGRLLALAAGTQAWLWDLNDGSLRGVLAGHRAAVSALAFAPDERTLASASLDRSVRLWRIGDGESQLAPLATIAGQAEPALSVAFSPDGALLAAGAADRSVRLWRTFDRSQVQTLSGHGGAVEALAFSPDGSLLAAGSRGRDLRLWETHSWRLRHTLDGHEGAVEALAFSPDSALIAAASTDQRVWLWRTAEGVLQRVLSGHTGPVAAVAFSPDGTTIASVGEDERLVAWEVPSGAQRTALRPLGGRVSSLALSADGTQLAVGASDGTLAVYHLEAEGAPRVRQNDHQGAIISIAFAGPGHLVTVASDRSVRACRLDGSQAAILLQTHGQPHAATLTADGRLLASSDGETTVQLWRLAAPGATPGGQFWRVLRGLRARPRRIAFAPRGDAIAVAADDHSIGLWWLLDLQGDRAEPALVLRSGGGRIRSLAFSADSGLLVAGGDSGSVQLWRTRDGGEALSLGSQAQPVTGLALTPEARSLAAGGADGTVQLWRLNLAESRRRLPAPTTLTGHAGAVEHLLFSPTGTSLITGAADGTVRIWRV